MALLLPFVAVCLYTDLADRKIYNNVIVCGIAAAFLQNMVRLGLLEGAVISLTGLLTGIFLLVLPFIAGGLGAGDVKMLGMIGAFLGHGQVVEVLLVSALVGGVFAVAAMIRGRGILRRLWNFFTGFIFFLFTHQAAYLRSLDESEAQKKAIPYGAALSAGVIIIYILGSMELNLPGFGPSLF
ncbi:MAG: prepilin peptidase [Dethiobacter sp.]|jgi:prepilin peptidase CpaA|nr:prepilin peptidase [Dethiobacter sp.]